jgi:hypothetical protein
MAGAAWSAFLPDYRESKVEEREKESRQKNNGKGSKITDLVHSHKNDSKRRRAQSVGSKMVVNFVPDWAF